MVYTLGFENPYKRCCRFGHSEWLLDGNGLGEPHKGFVGCFKSRWLGHISRTKSTFSGDEL